MCHIIESPFSIIYSYCLLTLARFDWLVLPIEQNTDLQKLLRRTLILIDSTVDTIVKYTCLGIIFIWLNYDQLEYVEPQK